MVEKIRNSVELVQVGELHIAEAVEKINIYIYFLKKYDQRVDIYLSSDYV